jgi:hypothetical protein
VTNAAAPRLVESYWIQPGRFLAGEYPAFTGDGTDAERLDELLNVGLDSFFDLTQPGELPPYLPILGERAELRGIHIEYQRFPILDLGLPEPGDTLSTLRAIDAALAAGKNVYLHCWGGVGRTGLTVGCFLVRHGRTGSEALQQLAEWWQTMPKSLYSPRSPETPEQAAYVLKWRKRSYAGVE